MRHAMRCDVMPSFQQQTWADGSIKTAQAAILGERFCAAVEILQKGPSLEQDFEPLAHTDIFPSNQSRPRHPLLAHHLRFTINAATTTTTTHYSPHSFSFRTAKATIVPGGRGITGQQSLLLGRLCPARSPRLPPPLKRMHKKPGEIIAGDPLEWSSFTVYPESLFWARSVKKQLDDW